MPGIGRLLLIGGPVGTAFALFIAAAIFLVAYIFLGPLIAIAAVLFIIGIIIEVGTMGSSNVGHTIMIVSIIVLIAVYFWP